MKHLALACALFLLSNISKAQLPPAFLTCPSTGFQVINTPTDFQTVNLATGTTTTVKTFTMNVNAIGYNPNDSRIYGIKQGTPLGVACIGSDYSMQLITTSGAALQGSVVGDISPAGILWCLSSTSVYTVDCNPADGINFGKVTVIGAKPAVSITDWSFPASDNTRIYTVTNTGSLVYISTTDLSVHVVMPAATVPAESYGATYFDSNGNFYAKGNTSGTIYKFINATTASPTVITFSSSSASAQNDGARCADAPAPVIADYGDAPNTFGTFASSGGAAHLLASPNPALAQIYLGAAVTIDEDGDPGTNANLDTDDGISSFTLIDGGPNPSSIASYSVTITAHNATASVANLAGWIDWNNDGIFDAGERAAVTVPANSTGPQILTWNNITLSGAPGTPGTYARFRISTDALPDPTGTVANGEVEDYFIPFATVLPVSLSSFSAVKSNQSVHVSWVTASEHNSKGFAIEHSENGTSFNQIGFVPSQAVSGTSSQAHKYDYYDTKPARGINYYRLKQTDVDGKVIYSSILKVIFGSGGNIITVYPNPARDKITIDGLKGNESIQLFSATGQLLKTEKATAALQTLTISDLTAGVYRLIVTDVAGKRITQKVIKQ